MPCVKLMITYSGRASWVNTSRLEGFSNQETNKYIVIILDTIGVLSLCDDILS